jgi:ABC-2 type transport system permease protein
MRDAIRLYLHYASVSLRGQMQYRASTILLALGNILLHGVEFLAIWAMFDRFGSLGVWSLPEVALLYGMANSSFAIAEVLGRGFDDFSAQVKSGEFDRLLLRPRSTAFQIVARYVWLSKLGWFAQGVVVLVWAGAALDVTWTVPKVALLLAAILSGAATFAGLFVLQATLCFWTTESLEVMATVTYGGVQTTQYPIAVYAKWFRRFFTFVVPLACMNYFPSLAITGRADPLGTPAWVPWASPLVGFAFLFVTLRLWQFGVRHYRSTGT